MMRALIALFVVATQLVAQTPPAPIAETNGKEAATWSAAEANAFAFVQRVAHDWRRGHELKGPWHHRSQLGNYAPAWAHLVPGQEAQLQTLENQLWHLRASQPDLLYVLPKHDGADNQRMFCVRGDGVVAFTDNHNRVSLNGDMALQGLAVLGAGGKGVLADFPRTPQRGRDGNIWMAGTMAPITHMQVLLVDDQGNPLSMTPLACEPVPPEFVIKRALPAARCKTTNEGKATLTGVRAAGLGLALQRARGTSPIEPKFVVVQGQRLCITLPQQWLLAQQIVPNESAAIATLKNISSAQSQCQASGVIDTDNDGRGEFGTFGEMSGRMHIRGQTKTIAPPVLSAAFGRVQNGIVSRSGYHFRLLLPGKNGAPTAEVATGGAKDLPLAADLTEQHWCCYAWPAKAGQSGQRAFFINDSGDVLVCQNKDGNYSGATKAPKPGAAFITAGDMRAKLAANQKSSDGQTWTVVH